MNTDINAFDYKKHLSNSLQWRWKIQDFKICDVIIHRDKSVTVIFTPKFKIFFLFTRLIYKKGAPLPALSSVRLVFIASIIGAGAIFGLKRKEGEVIARDFQIECNKPLMYDDLSKIEVTINITTLKKNEKYHLFESNFSIGENAEHVGKTKLFYCKPNTKEFSYL